MATTRPPGGETSRPVWTKKQQDMLEDLTRNRERAMAENRPPVLELINGATDLMQIDKLTLVDLLITNATAVRNVLRPFDLESQHE